MSASLQFSESNGAGEVVTDGISNLNFGNNDSANIVTATYPVVAGQNSYEKYIRLNFGGVFSEITNVKFYKSAGAYVTGEAIKAAANQVFATPVATTSLIATVDVPTAIGSALDIESTEGTPTKFTSAGYSKYLVLQAQSTGSSPSGSVNTKTFTVQWDEI